MPIYQWSTEKAQAAERGNRDWWPNQLKLNILRQHAPSSNPMDKDFNYAKEFNSLNLAEVKKDIVAALTTSQSWWPADYGHYGPFIIRMAWHRVQAHTAYMMAAAAGRGMQRFAR